MKIFLIVLIFINFSCSFETKIDKNTSLIDGKDNSFYFKSLTIEDFLSKINKYTKESEYPNLEN